MGASWKDGLSWQLMASAFYRISGYTGDGVRAGTYNSLGYPYVNYNGFGLAFAGGDVMYTGEKFAVRLDLRFGTGASLLDAHRAGQAGVRGLDASREAQHRRRFLRHHLRRRGRG